MYFSHGNRDSKGVIIMTKRKAKIKVEKIRTDNEGRIIMGDMIHDESRFILVNIYAPNDDKESFFVDTFKMVLEFAEEVGCQEKIVVGDLNLVLEVEKDKIGGRPVTHNKCQNVVKAFMDEEDLEDIYRVTHPEGKGITWKTLNPSPIYERLDYMLVSASLCEKVGTCGISAAYLSDHSIPWLILKPNRTTRGRGFWRLNVKLLGDDEYVNEMRTLFKEIFVGRLDENETVKKWEWFKHRVKEKSIQYSSRKNRDKENTIRLFEKKIKEYEERLVQMEKGRGKEKKGVYSEVIMDRGEILKQIEWIEKEMDELITSKTTSSMLRARKNWMQFGEKPSRYFLSLEGKTFKRKDRFQINKEKDQTLICGVKNVLQEQFEFYSELYASEHKFDICKFHKFTENLQRPKVKIADMEMLDSEFTLTELKDSIFRMKVEKVPGSDGICVEFYQKMFKEIKHVLLEVCKVAAKRGLCRGAINNNDACPL